LNKAVTEPNKPSDSSTDEELMGLVKKHDQNAFDILIRRHEEKLYHLAWSIVRNREDASDIVQEVFFTIWDNPGVWKPKQSLISKRQVKFTTWLFRVTTNRALNVQRSKKIKSLLSFSSDSDPEFSLELSSTSSEIDPDEALIKKEESLKFESAFVKLAPKQKAALHLRYRENLSVGDIAKSLNVSYKSAESLLFRGKVRLREILKKG